MQGAVAPNTPLVRFATLFAGFGRAVCCCCVRRCAAQHIVDALVINYDFRIIACRVIAENIGPVWLGDLFYPRRLYTLYYYIFRRLDAITCDTKAVPCKYA